MKALITAAPTRSANTKEAYEKRYEQLRARFEVETGKRDLAPDEVVAHLILLRPELARRSWRVYKNAVMHYLETYYPENGTAISTLKAVTSAGLSDGSANTSGRKIKHVPVAAWAAIRYALQQRIKRQHRYAHALLMVCESTLLTGLRPIEWAFSELGTSDEDGRPVLRVRNAKHSNGRANGSYREMYVDRLTAEEIEHIRVALEYCRCDTNDEAEKLQRALRHELEAARGVDLSPRRKRQSSVTLYSFRHQFVADAKRTFTDPTLTAAVCGHSSTKTAHEHYGRRKHGRDGVRVYPTAASIAEVQSRYLETYRDYVAKRGTPRAPNLSAST